MRIEVECKECGQRGAVLYGSDGNGVRVEGMQAGALIMLLGELGHGLPVALSCLRCAVLLQVVPIE